MTKTALLSTAVHKTTVDLSEEEQIELGFKPIEMSQFLKLRSLAGSIVSAMGDYFSAVQETPKQRTEVERDPLSGNEIRRVVETDGVSAEKAAQSSKQRQKAITSLVDLFLDPKHYETTTALIANSLRDSEYTLDDIKKTDLQVFAQLLLGFLDANMSVLYPLIGRLGTLTGAPEAEAAPEQ